MKIKKNYIKALITFPTLSLVAALPLSSYFADLTSKPAISNVVTNNQSSVLKDGDSPSAQTQTPTLDLNSDKINGQYNAKSFYVQNDMPVISNANGPVLLGDNGRSIAAYDWYGNPTWFLNLNSASSPNSAKDGTKSDAQASYYKYSNALSSQIDWSAVGTKIVDTAYLASRDFLYVLTDTSYLFLIQSTTGTINSVKKLEHNINKIALIDFNKSLYGWDSTKNNCPVYDIDTQKLTMTTAMQQSASGINNQYIFDILPLDVGYNIALLSSTPLNTNANGKSTISLTATFIQDNGNKFKNSSNQDLNGKDQTITLSDFNSINEVYSTTLSRGDSNILIVGNNIYNIILNKSAMENTVFTQLNTTTSGAAQVDASQQSSNTITFQKINSAFVDESNLIYLKDGSQNIYQISLDNKITENMTIPTNTSNGSIFDTNAANSARIYPVLKNSTSEVSRKGTGYVASPTAFVCTGFTNGSLLKNNFNSTASRPYFSLPSNYSSSAPSSFDSSNISLTIASSSDPYSTEFYSDDLSGELYVKTKLSIPSWYDNSYNAFTSSYVIGKWNCAKIETVTKWVNQLQFNQVGGGILSKRSPNQISDQDVTKYATEILQLPSVVTSSSYKDIKIIVTKRDEGQNKANGQITLKATVKYQNKKGTIVSYVVDNGTFNVKKEANKYKFQFYGGKADEIETENVDISTLGSAFANFKNTLPTLIKPTSDNLEAFIQIEDKYPTDSRRVITISNADDTTGSITITVHYNNLEPTTQANFSITYTGLTTTNQNNVNFKGDKISDDKIPVYDGKPVYENEELKDITSVAGYTDYNQKLATDIDVSQINLVYDSNLKLMGFNPEVSIEKDSKTGTISSIDAEYGSIQITLDYTKSKSELLGITLPEKYWNSFGLKNGKISQRYIGFLPIGSTYGITLKSYNSPEVQNVVQNNNVNADIPISELLSTLDVKGYNNEGGTPDIIVQNFVWDGENLQFSVHAQSKKYNTVSTDKTFNISWTPKFAAIRERNLIVASTTSILGVAIVSGLIALYILRRNKIRRLLK